MYLPPSMDGPAHRSISSIAMNAALALRSFGASPRKGSSGERPRAFPPNNVGWLLDRTCGERPRASRSALPSWG